MARFSGTTRTATRSPITSNPQRGLTTHEGGAGYARDAKSELFLLAVANMVGQDTFYEAASDRDSRFRDLVRSVALSDAGWLAGFAGWLRSDALMRSAPIVLAAEAVRARLEAGDTSEPSNRALIGVVCQRPDEPAELLGYWLSTYGKPIPRPVKRGLSDAILRLYTERAALKWDSGEHAIRMGDVVELVQRGKVDRAWQSALFRWLLDQRHNPSEVRAPLDLLPMVRARRDLFAVPVGERRALLRDDPGALVSAGVTWEALSGWLQGPMDSEAWTAIIPSMGTMALVRNLRNFDQAGVADAIAATVAAKIADPNEVRKSRQFPFRYLSAIRNVTSLRWGHALERALQASLSNVPALPGRTLVLVDRSGSMFGDWSATPTAVRVRKSTGLDLADVAAVFGSALAMRAQDATLVQFGTDSAAVPFGPGDALLRVVDRFSNLGGTNTALAVRRHYAGHDRVVIVTDEQTSAWNDPLAGVPANVPTYTWNLNGYQVGHGASGSGSRHTFGGLSDAAFRLIPLLEAGRNAGWPWEQTEQRQR